MAITRLRSRLREEAGLYGTGLSVSQVAVLQSVATQATVTAAELAKLQHVSPQAIAQTLGVLEAEGLVGKERDPADGRKTLIHCTEAGTRLLTSFTTAGESFLEQAVDRLVPPGERADLERAIALLERFAAADLDGKGGRRT
ncbi:MarR family winged helix-turn-helix transcriptional regulator [Streptomyces sp. NBC_00096]|uniref:MarR family winged helix-turn-helix transcriptional regulator n=1 Tax=Streptomyces sp. NBC_00096 TaxID=2975650 RepID=UPI003246ECDC